MSKTVTVFFDQKRCKWVVQSDDFRVWPEYFNEIEDAEQFAGDMRKAGEDR